MKGPHNISFNLGWLFRWRSKASPLSWAASNGDKLKAAQFGAIV
jgi:hypothetical protein